VEEIQSIEEKESEEKHEGNNPTLVTTNVGEFSVIRRALYAKDVPL